MSYLVLARKYRSQNFEEIVEQKHVTRTLQNAISTERLAHAILFCGPRGTGKTSIARILAKAVNCLEGPSPTPCNKCKSCISITEGRSMDVIEIDGASNNSVDQIRELRENLAYSAMHSKYRIYIIDEVHMLSTAAFNALLKTLEEPPSHVLFFFATTEVHKIPLTILSRCQRHDLHRIDARAIKEHLTGICRAEKLDLNEKTLGIIAKEADGSIRDALSLLDRVISSLKGREDDSEKIRTLLGISEDRELFQLSRAIFEQDTLSMLKLMESFHKKGLKLGRIKEKLSLHIRNLLIVKTYPENSRDILELSDSEIEELKVEAEGKDHYYLSQLLDMLVLSDDKTRYSSNPRIAMEVLFLRCMRIRPALSIKELINRLDTMQKSLEEQKDHSKDKETFKLLSEKKKIKKDPYKDLGEDKNDKKEAENIASESLKEDKTSLKKSSYKSIEDQNLDLYYGDLHENIEENQAQAEIEDRKENRIPEDTACKIDEEDEGFWPKLIKRVKLENRGFGIFLEDETELKELSDKVLELEIEDSDLSKNRFTRENRELIERLCHSILKQELKLKLKTGPQKKKTKIDKQKEKLSLKEEAEKHSLVQDALSIFKAEIIDIEINKI